MHDAIAFLDALLGWETFAALTAALETRSCYAT
jgi:hypothetical protein